MNQQPIARWQETECDAAIAAAKRDLAVKALAIISQLWIDTLFDGHWRNGFGSCQGHALRELNQLFQ
jgi:hypothetical protein